LFKLSDTDYFAKLETFSPNIFIKENPEYLLSHSNAINIAKHIHQIYKDQSIYLKPEPKAFLEKTLEPGGINPDAFFIISDLLITKSENPIETACKYVKKAMDNAETAKNKKKFIKARQWDEITAYCEQRVCNLLDITAEIIPQNYGVTGTVFTDFGPKHHVTDVDGEPARINVVDDISVHEENGKHHLIITVAAARHGLDEDAVIQVSDVEGMKGINECISLRP